VLAIGVAAGGVDELETSGGAEHEDPPRIDMSRTITAFQGGGDGAVMAAMRVLEPGNVDGESAMVALGSAMVRRRARSCRRCTQMQCALSVSSPEPATSDMSFASLIDAESAVGR
jgi:hypothetical protein